MTRTREVIAAAVVAFIACTANAAPRYTAVPLGTLGGQASFGFGINDAGQVTGWSWITGNNVSHPFIYDNGRMTDIGSLGGEVVQAQAINNNGQVVGSDSKDARTAHAVLRAFVYSNGNMTDIGGFLGAGVFSVAHGNNDRGQVTGGAAGGNWSGNAWLYNAGVVTDIGTLGGPGSNGFAINNHGQVTGDSLTAGGTLHAFLYTNGTMLDLGALASGHLSHGYAINDVGQVAGSSDIEFNPGPSQGAPAPAHHAFLYSNGLLSDLGTLGGTSSDGYGINASGDIVGMSDAAPGSGSVAILYTDGKMFDLNTLVESGLNGATLHYARGINKKGQIVADGCSAGMCQAYRLDPIQSDDGGGGCASIAAAPVSPIDPTLPALLLTALGAALAGRQGVQRGHPTGNASPPAAL